MLLASPGIQGMVGGLCGNFDGDEENDDPRRFPEEYYVDPTQDMAMEAPEPIIENPTTYITDETILAQVRLQCHQIM